MPRTIIRGAMDLMSRLGHEPMEIQAPSQTVEEARSHSEPHLTTAVGSVSAAAADDPSTPNTKDPAAVRLDDEDSHSECNGGGTSAREMPPWRRRGSARKAPKKSPTEVPKGKAKRSRGSAPKASFSWTASPPPTFSVSALFVSSKGLGIAQKQLAASTTIATCIPLWPTYALDIKGAFHFEYSADRWLHFEKKEEWVQAIFGIDGSKANKSIDEPKNSSQLPSGPRGANFPLTNLTVRATSRATRISICILRATPRRSRGR